MTGQALASIMVNGIVCPTRAPETQVFVKHSKLKLEEKNVRTTYMAKPGEVERKWYVVDATDVPLGRLSTVVASMLRGKNKPTFTPHVDTGDFVIVINCDQAVLTGKKLEQKYYYRHSGWIGGLKQTQYKVMMEERSDEAMQIAIKGMLPHNSQGAAQLTRLRTYKGAEHKQAAQKPEVCEF